MNHSDFILNQTQEIINTSNPKRQHVALAIINNTTSYSRELLQLLYLWFAFPEKYKDLLAGTIDKSLLLFQEDPQSLEYNNSYEWIEALLQKNTDLRLTQEKSIPFYNPTNLSLDDIYKESYIYQAHSGSERFLIRQATDTYNSWHHKLFLRILSDNNPALLYSIREIRQLSKVEDLAPFLVDKESLLRDEAKRLYENNYI
jgi:hypothetical protein